MEVAHLQREIMDAERLAERGKMILGLNEEVLKLRQENGELRTLIAELEAKAATKTEQ
jgi:hypothetical protein